jgi:hypothetical protein
MAQANGFGFFWPGLASGLRLELAHYYQYNIESTLIFMTYNHFSNSFFDSSMFNSYRILFTEMLHHNTLDCV